MTTNVPNPLLLLIRLWSSVIIVMILFYKLHGEIKGEQQTEPIEIISGSHIVSTEQEAEDVRKEED